MPESEPKRAKAIRAAPSEHIIHPSDTSSLHQQSPEQPFRRPSKISSGFENLNFHNANMGSIDKVKGSVTSNFQRSTSTQQPPVGKMLLPPLQGSHAARPGNKSLEKSRTSHACDKCRRAKAKCSGGYPCDKCKNEGKDCVYGAGKRDRERLEMVRVSKRYKQVKKRNTELTELLKQLGESGQLSPENHQEVFEVLAKFRKSSDSESGEDDNRLSARRADQRRTESYSNDEDNSSGERDADGDVGSTGSLAVTNVDANRNDDTRADGFMGKSASVNWLRRAKDETEGEKSELHPNIIAALSSENPPSASNYLTNNSDRGGIEDMPVHPYEWPPRDVARSLVESYFQNVHTACPFFLKSDFMAAFNTFPRDQSTMLTPHDETWLCLINLVFAIGAKFAHLTDASHQGDERDDILYFARAKNLGMDDRILYKDAELERTSCLGLLVIYLMATNQLNRAWIINGVSLRYAVSLGLHIKNETTSLSDVDKEIRIRIWWSLYSLERFLDALTGRPSCISSRDISTPLPINQDEELFDRNRPLDYSLRPDHPRDSSEELSAKPYTSDKSDLSPTKSPCTERPRTAVSSSASRRASTAYPSFSTTPSTSFALPTSRLPYTNSTFFIYSIQLSIICQDILVQLYSAATVDQKWSDIQSIIRTLDQRLQSWKSLLPVELDFDAGIKDKYVPQRRGLQLFYESSRMTLFRPCLCRFEGRIPHESEESKNFNQDAVRSCLDSARAIVATFSDTPDPSEVYKISPWWNALHYLCEAASILMLEIAYRAQHVPSHVDDIFRDAKKAVRWLRTLSGTSISARKGWEIFDGLLRDVSGLIGQTTNDMDIEAPLPPKWCHKSQDETIPEASSANNSRAPAFHSQPTYGNSSGFSNMPQDTIGDWVQHGQFDHLGEYPPTTYTSFNTNYLQALAPASMAGNLYSRYDEFGPWQGSFSQSNHIPPTQTTRSTNFAHPTHPTNSTQNTENFLFSRGGDWMGSTGTAMGTQELTTSGPVSGIQAPMGLGVESMQSQEGFGGFQSQQDWYMPMEIYPDGAQGRVRVHEDGGGGFGDDNGHGS